MGATAARVRLAAEPPGPRWPGLALTALVWLRRDLRLHDHPALRAALDHHDRVVPVFCFDDRLLHGRHASGPRTQFLLECLADLDASLRVRGSRVSSCVADRPSMNCLSSPIR